MGGEDPNTLATVEFEVYGQVQGRFFLIKSFYYSWIWKWKRMKSTFERHYILKKLLGFFDRIK